MKLGIFGEVKAIAQADVGGGAWYLPQNLNTRGATLTSRQWILPKRPSLYSDDM